MKPHSSVATTLLALLVCASTTPVEAQRSSLADLSLEELMDIEVTSVSRKKVTVAEAAAAIAVVTADDIRRAGATTLAEALKLAPGVHVARIDASKWAVAVRGFNGHYVAHLLVLIDGRSVYSPLFSGVFWEVLDLPLADIARIEVIRGPGATMWGANAVNGIINIITEKADASQGLLLTTGAGTEERAFGTLRYGGALGESAHYRAYLKYANRDELGKSGDLEPHDAWSALHAGVRLDWQVDEDEEAIFQGRLFRIDTDETLAVPTLAPPHTAVFEERRSYGGGHLQGRWRRTLSEASEVALQAYYEGTDADGGRRAQPGGPFREVRHTFDVDAQHRLGLTPAHELMWGLGYRITRDRIEGVPDFSVDPDQRTDQLFSAFVQDQVDIRPDRLLVSVGSKFEHNDYTGFEFQPSLRLLYRPHLRHSLWGALSRAVRTPTRLEHDARLLGGVLGVDDSRNPGDLPIALDMHGDRGMESETLVAWEAGYRAEVTPAVAVDVTGFWHAYDDLRTLEPEPGLPTVDTLAAVHHVDWPFRARNRMSGDTYGAEAAFDWQPLPTWGLQATYSYLQMSLRLDDDSADEVCEILEDESPDHQLGLRSTLDVHRDANLFVGLRYTGALDGQQVGSHVDVDARLEWRVRRDLSFALVGRNLLDSRHLEFSRQAFINTQSTEVQREVYMQWSWEWGRGR